MKITWRNKGLYEKHFFLCYSLSWIHNFPNMPHSRVFIYTYATFYVGGRNKFVTQRQKLLLVVLLFDFGLGDLHFLWHHMPSSQTKHFLNLLMSNMAWPLPHYLHYWLLFFLLNHLLSKIIKTNKKNLFFFPDVSVSLKSLVYLKTKKEERFKTPQRAKKTQDICFFVFFSLYNASIYIHLINRKIS